MRDLVGKGKARETSVGYTPMHGRDQNKQRGREMKNAHFFGEREGDFLLTRVLSRRWEGHTRFIFALGKLDLKALGLGWSVGEGGEEDAFSSFP